MTEREEFLKLIKEVQNDLADIKFDLFSLHPDPMLTTKEAARYMKVSPQQILRYVKCGLEYFETGRGWKFRRSTFDRFAEANFKRKAV
jgi:excisionase family DNA binding protein